MEVRIIDNPKFINTRVSIDVINGVADIENPVLYVPAEIAKDEDILIDVYLQTLQEIERRKEEEK
jgi:hypothetical protein